MKALKYFVFFFVCFSANLAQAQLDSSYIKKYNYRIIFNPGIIYKDFKVSFDTDFSAPVFFQNASFGFKLRLKYKWIGLYYTIPIASTNAPQGANPKHFGGTLSLYRTKYLLRIGLRRFKGFTSLDALNNGQSQEAFFDDMRMWYNEIDFTYILSNRRYSLRSAFKFSGRQLKSKGSFLLTSQWNYQNFTTDSLALLLSPTEALTLEAYQNFRLGFGGGYAYTYVRNRFFATLVLTGGGEFRRLIYNFEEERRTDNRWRVSPRVKMQFGFGLTNKRYFAGINGYYLPGLDYIETLNTRVKDFRIQLVVGLRLFRYDPEYLDY